TCYEKHAKWAACLPDCTAGVQLWVDWFWRWTPWTCMLIVDAVGRDELGTELETSDADPLLASATPHRYKNLANKFTTSGSTIYDDAENMRLVFVSSADKCKTMCDADRRCDCFLYTSVTQHCEKRRACAPDAQSLKDNVGTNLYVKLPNEEIQEEDDDDVWKRYRHKNLFFSTGLRLDDEDAGATTLKSCKRRCELSKSCQCFVYSEALDRCERYTDCVVSTLIEDALYDVYVTEEPKPKEPVDFAWWTILQLILLVLLLLLCCFLCIYFLRKKEPRDAVAVPFVPTKTRLEMFADAALLERWPGSCADCGCACGRPPAWVPRSGAVVATEASTGNVQTRPDGGGNLVPGDVLLTIRSGGKVAAIHCTDDVKEVLSRCQAGQTIDMEVLRARAFGEYSCSRPSADEAPSTQATMDKPDEVEKAALPTHKKVHVQRLVE
ncbi:PSP, partial [Symbiodinium pilosum]